MTAEAADEGTENDLLTIGDEVEDGVRLPQVTIRSPAAIEVVKGFEDPDQLALLVDHLLAAVGNVAKGASTVQEFVSAAERLLDENLEQLDERSTEILEQVQDEIRELKQDLEGYTDDLVDQAVEDVVENNAEVREVLGDETEAIKEALKEDVTDTLMGRLNDVAEKLEAQKAAEEARAEAVKDTPQGGIEFQDWAYKRLSDAFGATKTAVKKVADTTGIISRCKTGDITVDRPIPNHGFEVRAIVEAKDEDKTSASKVDEVIDEAERAIQNREADACLFLFRERSQMPEGLPPIKFGKDYVITSVEAAPLTSLVELATMVGAMNIRIERSNESEDDFDVDAALETVTELEDLVEDLEEVHRLLGLIEGHAENAADLTLSSKEVVEEATIRLTRALDPESP